VAREIVIVRHGETEWSLSGQHTSRTDLPLLEEGRRDARALAPMLAAYSFDAVLTSPMARARDTCELAGLGGGAEVDKRLCEWDYGDYEGLTTPEIHAERPDWDLWRDGCPSGEQPSDVQARADALLTRCAEVDGSVILFAHGHLLRVLSARWLELPVQGGARFKLDAAAPGRLGYERQTRVLLGWNLTPHP
jgi:broad specificity phosphatase PhoE